MLQLYSGGLCKCATTIGTPQQSQHSVANLYSKGLAAAAELQRQAIKPEMFKIRQSAVRELADWLHSKQDTCSKSLQTAVSEDILVYFTHVQQ